MVPILELRDAFALKSGVGGISFVQNVETT
jgi:hypothetical protein